MAECFDWKQELDEAGRSAFMDFQTGENGTRRKESAEILKTVYTMHLAEERAERELALKEKEANIELAETIIDGIGKGAMVIGTGAGLGFGIWGFSRVTALEDSYKVVSNRTFQWTLQQVLKPAMSMAMQLCKF